MGQETIFNRKLHQHKPLIKYLANKLKILGVLEPEDLYQEGCIVLDSVLREYVLDPDTEDFDKYFHVAAYHGMVSAVRSQKAAMRDHRKTVIESEMGYEGEGDGRADTRGSFFETMSAGQSPEEVLSHKYSEAKVENFLSDLVDMLETDAVCVLLELISPSPMEDIEVYAYFQRIPSSLGDNHPTWLIAQQLGLSRSKVRRLLCKIRRAASSLMGLYNLPDMSCRVRA